MKRVRAAVIGLGNWGECHAATLAALLQAELVAVCDARLDRAEEVAQRFNIDDFTDAPDELLQRDDIDLVSIVTPEAEHLPLVLQALGSGKHVLVEKPAAICAIEAQRMADAARTSGRYLMPGHILRFDPRYAAVRDAIAAGEIGPVVSLFSRRARPQALFELYGRTHLAFVTTIHDIDLAIWYTGSRVRRVRAHERHVTGGETPDLLWATLEFENDAIAVLHSTWLVPDAARVGMADFLEVVGGYGILRVDASQSGFEQWGEKGRHSPDFSIHHQFAGGVIGALRNELGYLCDCILRGEAPEYVPFGDAVHGLEVAAAIVESAQTGEVVKL